VTVLLGDTIYNTMGSAVDLIIPCNARILHMIVEETRIVMSAYPASCYTDDGHTRILS